MLLKKLIKFYPKHSENFKVKGLAIDSRDVKKDYIFFALKGQKFNGENYIRDAVIKGAKVIVCSKKCNYKNDNIILIKKESVKKILSETTSKFYKLKPKNIIAVTGTNGKTSVAEYFRQILNINNIPVATIGTLGIKYKNKTIKTGLTTPDIITLHKNLEKLKKQKIDNVIIEASSHGLHQSRLEGLNLKAGIFTNFSQDHLDYHKNMRNYLKSKLILFTKLLTKNKYIIANGESKYFLTLKKISKRKKLKLIDNSFIIKKIETKDSFLKASFQIKNLSMAMLAARLCNLSDVQINKIYKNIKSVIGRLELVKKYSGNIKVYVDYAHTPEALSEALNSLRNSFGNKISVVFGCGGERDKKKRSQMAKIAKMYCKKIYVTDDNPRFENPRIIRKAIIKHLGGSNYKEIGNRSQAIKTAILNADPNENILIAGKGHEDYQVYGDKTISISDKDLIKRVKKNKINIIKNIYKFNSSIIKKIARNKKVNNFNQISIDTRNLKKNNLFLALKGKNYDGHNFISNAIKKGANLIISSKKLKKLRLSNKIIKVSQPIKFLKKFAKLKRENCNAKVIAITGSAGKTSLKDMLYNTFVGYGVKTFASPKSYNNDLGVPLSLSNLNLFHQLGIFEIGMSKAGEIKRLSNIVKPDLAIITNIAEAHIENFKNLKGIAKAKGEIIDNIAKNGTLVINRDDKFFKYFYKKAISKNLKVLSFGISKKADINLLKSRAYKNNKIIFVNINGVKISLKIKNTNIYNVLSTLAVLSKFDLNFKKFASIMKDYQPTIGRGKIHKIRRYKKHFNLIDESYNANPLSVKNAIKNFNEIKKHDSKKYLLLGDMLELGKKTKIYHKKVSKLINSSDIDKVFVKGENTLITFKNLDKNKRGNVIQCSQDIDLILQNIIANNDYLMIKGSNATGLNTISNLMIKGV